VEPTGLSTLRSRLLRKTGSRGFLPLARQSFSGEREGGYNSLVEKEVEAYYPLAGGYSLFHVFGITI